MDLFDFKVAIDKISCRCQEIFVCGVEVVKGFIQQLSEWELMCLHF